MKKEIEKISEAYTYGSIAYEKCPVAKFQIQEINKIINARFGILLKENKNLFPVHNCEFCHNIIDDIRYIKK